LTLTQKLQILLISLWKALRRHPPSAWITLAVSLLLTVAGWHVSNHFIQNRAADRYAFQVKDVLGAIQQRMKTYESMLRGATGLFIASEEVNRREWLDYIRTMQIDRDYPGILNVGRVDWHQDAQGPARAVVTYLAPETDVSRSLIGHDLYAEATLRTVMDRARDTGNPALSGLVTLNRHSTSETRLKQRSLYMFMPLYQPGSPIETPEQRRAALTGWVYSAFHSQDLLHEILGASNAEIDVEVFDGTEMRRDTMLYHDLGEEDPHLGRTDYQPDFVETTHLNFGGQIWSLFIHTQPGYIAASDTGQPIIIAFGGLVLDILLFLMIGAISDRHQQAHRIAGFMTEGLQQSEIRLRAILDNFPFMVWLKDDQGRFLAVNDAYAHACGRPDANSVVGLSEFDLWPQDIAQAHEDQSAQVMGERLERIAFSRIARAGQERWMEVHYGPWCSTSGEVLGTVGYAYDITDHKETERALRASERRFRQLFEQSAVGTVLIAPDQTEVLDANEQFAQLCGYSRAQLLGLPLQDLLVLEGDETPSGWLSRMHIPSEDRRSHEALLRHRQGQPVWVTIGLIHLHDDSLPLPLMVMSVVDISQRKFSEQALQAHQADRSLRLDVPADTTTVPAELDGLQTRAPIATTGASETLQQLGTLLTCLIGYSEIASRHPTPDAGLRRSLEVIRHASRESADLLMRLQGRAVTPLPTDTSPARPLLWLIEPDPAMRRFLLDWLQSGSQEVRCFDRCEQAQQALPQSDDPETCAVPTGVFIGFSSGARDAAQALIAALVQTAPAANIVLSPINPEDLAVPQTGSVTLVPRPFSPATLDVALGLHPTHL
jgi:PAS domain S-box-containing protein